MHQLTFDGLAEGRRRRDDGIATVSSNGANADWRARAEEKLSDLIAVGRPFTAVDLIEAVGLPPSPNGVGALFNGARRARRIKQTGHWVKSRRPDSHARNLPEWVATS